VFIAQAPGYNQTEERETKSNNGGGHPVNSAVQGLLKFGPIDFEYSYYQKAESQRYKYQPGKMKQAVRLTAQVTFSVTP
jgi:hypothetical protein